MNEFKLKFRGVRGSIPVPGKDTLKYGGNTTCLELRVNGNLIILDAGTGIIKAGNQMLKDFFSQSDEEKKINPMTATMLFSHTHMDHIMGLPFFTPIYIGSTNLYMFGGKYYDRDFKKALDECMHAPLFPVEFDDLQSFREVSNIKEGQYLVFKEGQKKPILDDVFRPQVETNENDVKVYFHQSYAHPSDGSMVYKIEYKGKKVIFATDVEGYQTPDTRLVNFSKNADILIHDAQYTKEQYKTCQGFGHSTMEMAIDVAKAANVKRLYLFHHDPRHSDETLDKIHNEMKNIYDSTFMATEEEEIDLFNL
ncbi:MAG: MBL fold metallo-hydrolase [Candidatus Sericytochromatia bacterium]